MQKILTVLLITVSTQIMAQKEIKTSIIIDASPETIWGILTDTKDYPNWNPFITHFEGALTSGNNISITAGGMSFKPEVRKVDPNKELRWLGKLLWKGLFDGEHIFRISENSDGSCTFFHEEKFSGLLVGLFAKKLDTDTREGFIAMNQKLKELAENK